MRRIIPASLVAIAALLLASVLLTSGGPAGAAPKGSPWGANYFPNVPLVTQDGAPVRFYDDLLKDRIVVINFIYTSCPDACPLETAKLVEVQKLLGDRVGKDIFMYSISFDPKRDTPAVLKAYAEKFHVGPGWTFLTGKKEDIDLLRKKLGLYFEADLSTPNDHSAQLIMGNEATDHWMPASAFDNPQYLAVMIGDWLADWKYTKPGQSYAEVPKLPVPEKGQHLFQSRCTVCHTIGQGDRLGPDLLGVTKTRDRAWLTRWLQAPDRMLAEKDPLATALFVQYKNVPMPNLRLGETDVDSLLAYLEAQSALPRQSEGTKPAGEAGESQHGHHHHGGGEMK